MAELPPYAPKLRRRRRLIAPEVLVSVAILAFGVGLIVGMLLANDV